VTAPAGNRRPDPWAELERLREQVIELGEQVTSLTVALGEQQARPLRCPRHWA
jgi:hypothetical protein